MKLLRTVLYKAGRWGAVLALCSLASWTWAAEKDWLDEMPDVPAVVQAVRGDDCTSQLGDDEDRLAAEIVGTLTMLRWIMLFQALEEGGATPPRFPTAKWVMENATAGLEKMAKTRSARLQSLEASYMQAELVIGLGTGKRSGFLTKQKKCDTDASFSMRLGNRDVGCYHYWFHNAIGSISSSINHRREMLPKLFPKDREQHYIDLVTRYVLLAPGPYEPSLTLTMPPGSGYAMPESDYCTSNSYGGDSNGNGLCDAWEKPLSRTARAGSSADGSCSPCIGDTKDSDGDGMPDEWETGGIQLDNGRCVPFEVVFDFNGDGVLDDKERPDPYKKDIYVEVDWIINHKPDPNFMNQVINAFFVSPVKNPDRNDPVNNPNGGATGVNLHILLDEQIDMNAACCKGRMLTPTPFLFSDVQKFPGSASFDDIKKDHFGTRQMRAMPNKADILEARGKVFRYVLFIDRISGTEESGTAEIFGDDFVVASGIIDELVEAQYFVTQKEYRKKFLKAAFFMHELGHTLGLRHGGRDDIHCKPNYLSVMNYYRAYGVQVDPHVLDYSRFELPPLYESALDETTGLRGSLKESSPEWQRLLPQLPGYSTAHGPEKIEKMSTIDEIEKVAAIVRADAPQIDWNRNAKIDPVRVAADINEVKIGPLKVICTGLGKRLCGHDDWSNLKYNFRTSPHYGDHQRVVPAIIGDEVCK